MEDEKNNAVFQEQTLKKEKDYLQEQLETDKKSAMCIKKQKDELLDKIEKDKMQAMTQEQRLLKEKEDLLN